MGKLVHLLSNGTAREIRLDRERITIGRRPDNDLCLPQAAVSGAHAAIVTILADSFLEDLGSTNGTLVNGKAIKKHFLRDRDEIDIGREILVYLADDTAKLEPSAWHGDRPGSAAAGSGADAEVSSAGGGAAANGVPRGKRRSDRAAPAPPPADAASRTTAADAAPGGDRTDPGPTGEPAGQGPVEPEGPATTQPAEPVPAVRVLTGKRAGHLMPLAKSETLVGRAGVQVAALLRTGGEIRVVPVEGASPPRINGNPVGSDGERLATGDILEIAGARLELVAPTQAPA